MANCNLRQPARAPVTKTHFILLQLGILLLWVISSVSLHAQSTFPTLTGRVVDNAKMLSSSEQAVLESKLADFEKQYSDQIVVVTIASLNGANLEAYANRLFRHWGLGQADQNNGVLLLIVKNDRKIRIEVGYGLEGQLTDALSKLIIDGVIVPRFKANQFSQGISEGAEMIIKVLSGEERELIDHAKRNSSQLDWFTFGILLLWASFLFFPFFFGILSRIFGVKLGPGRYRWLGIETGPNSTREVRRRRRGELGRHESDWMSGSGGGFGGGGGFSGGGGSSGGGGASGGW